MTVDEVTDAFEKGFIVSDEVGFPLESPSGAVDRSKAPSGDRYVTITSGGVKEGMQPMPVWFASEEQAAAEWLRHAWVYADKHVGKLLYWRMRPVWRSVDVVAIRQAEAMNDQDLRGSVTMCIGAVVARLAIADEAGEVEGA